MVEQYTSTHGTIQYACTYVQYLVAFADQQLLAVEEEVSGVGTVLPVVVQLLEEAQTKKQEDCVPVVKVVECTIGLAGGLVVGV